MNSAPRNILVLIIAKISSPFEILYEKIWVTIMMDMTKIANVSSEKYPVAVVMIKNQKEIPIVTARDLNLGEDNSILNRINECN